MTTNEELKNLLIKLQETVDLNERKNEERTRKLEKKIKKIEVRVKAVCKIFSLQNQLHEMNKMEKYEDLEELEEELKDSVCAAVLKANFKKKFPCKAIAVQDVMTDEIACLFNTDGGNGKKSFVELQLYTKIMRGTYFLF